MVFVPDVTMTSILRMIDKKGPFVRPAQVADVKVIRSMCGTLVFSRRNNVQDNSGHTDSYPLKDFALRCNVCGNPLATIINSDSNKQ